VNPFDLSTRWNIFARELEDIMAAHGLRLSQLDDRGIVLHRQKVWRLQQSLRSPSHLTTLNPAEMGRLANMLQLTELEQTRLRAALLATAVEMTLLDRIDAETALMASNDVFSILFETMRARPDMVMTTGVKGGVMIEETNTSTDMNFAQALDLIDRAMLAIHVSRNAVSLQAQVAHARDAFNVFTRSLELLQQCLTPHHESDDWRYWYSEADDGRQMAESLMQLGGA
jgi:hypothetical protein